MRPAAKGPPGTRPTVSIPSPCSVRSLEARLPHSQLHLCLLPKPPHLGPRPLMCPVWKASPGASHVGLDPSSSQCEAMLFAQGWLQRPLLQEAFPDCSTATSQHAAQCACCCDFLPGHSSSGRSHGAKPASFPHSPARVPTQHELSPGGANGQRWRRPCSRGTGAPHPVVTTQGARSPPCSPQQPQEGRTPESQFSHL